MLVATAVMGAEAMSQTLNEDVVLRIDASTGAASIENSGDASVSIDAYEVNSALGFLDPAGWSSIAPTGGWEAPAGSTANSIAELNPSATPLTLAATGSQAIGNPFDADNTGFDAAITAAGFGNDYLDVEFLFGEDNANEQFQGLVIYENQRFNNLVLEINTSSGAASLINESTLDVSIDLIEFSSSAGALNPNGFNGIRDTQAGWQTSNQNSANGLIEFLPGDGSPAVGETIAGGTSFTLGNAFDAGNAARDVAFAFHILGGDDNGFAGAVRYVGSALPGDFNGDGLVNSADFTVWRDNLGAADETALMGNGDGLNGVDIGDYNQWKANFSSAGAASLSAGSDAAVPEPGAAVLLLAGLIVTRITVAKLR